MAYPVLSVNPSLVFPRETTANTLDSGQGIGRSLRRTVDDRVILGYKVKFDNLPCGERDSLLAVIHTPFQLNTPDDGVVNVVILDDTISISSDSPTTFSVTFSVEQVLFT